MRRHSIAPKSLTLTVEPGQLIVQAAARRATQLWGEAATSCEYDGGWVVLRHLMPDAPYVEHYAISRVVGNKMYLRHIDTGKTRTAWHGAPPPQPIRYEMMQTGHGEMYFRETW